MKKFLALIMAAAMLLSCVAFAEESVNPVEIDRTLESRLELAWIGDWTLSAAYIGEEFIDEFGVEGVEPGLLTVTPGAITMTINAELDHCASDRALGQIVDQGAYLHAHVYCMLGTMAFAGYEDEEYKLESSWDEWAYVVRGEMDGDFNYGPAKTHIKGDDDLLHWAEITGVEVEDMEEMKYIFINTSGQLVLCYAEKNLTKEKNNTVGVAYIFDKVVPAEETVAE